MASGKKTSAKKGEDSDERPDEDIDDNRESGKASRASSPKTKSSQNKSDEKANPGSEKTQILMAPQMAMTETKSRDPDEVVVS